MNIKIGVKWIVNPFNMYVITFALAIIFYLLKWTRLYKLPIDDYLVTFFICTFSFSLIFSLLYGSLILKREKFVFSYKKVRFDFIFYMIIIGVAGEIIHFGNVPLLMCLQKIPMDYTKFGIKTFHVLLFPLVSYYYFVCFYRFLVDKNSVNFFKTVTLFLIPFFTVQRSYLVIMFVGSIMILCINNRFKLSFKKVSSLATGFVVLFMLFAYLGNIRSGSTTVEQVFKPSQSFYMIGLSDKFMWPYIYFSSPMANLNKNISDSASSGDLSSYSISSYVPDFISKHFIYDKSFLQVSPNLNVATMFAFPYKFGGIFGMFLYFAFISLLAFLYTCLAPKNNMHFNLAIMLITCMFVFGFLMNMIVYSGFMIQLFYNLLALLKVSMQRSLARCQ